MFTEPFPLTVEACFPSCFFYQWFFWSNNVNAIHWTSIIYWRTSFRLLLLECEENNADDKTSGDNERVRLSSKKRLDIVLGWEKGLLDTVSFLFKLTNESKARSVSIPGCLGIWWWDGTVRDSTPFISGAIFELNSWLNSFCRSPSYPRVFAISVRERLTGFHCMDAVAFLGSQHSFQQEQSLVSFPRPNYNPNDSAHNWNPKWNTATPCTWLSVIKCLFWIYTIQTPSIAKNQLLKKIQQIRRFGFILAMRTILQTNNTDGKP